MTTVTTKAFKALRNFATDLEEVFSDNDVQDYSKELRSIDIHDIEAIKKHVKLFQDFYEKNKNEFLSQEIKLKQPILHKVHIESILKASDKDERTVIFQHILTIGQILDPSEKIKNLLHSLKLSSTEEIKTNTSNVLGDIISKIEKQVQDSDTSNPTEAISRIMQSGVFTEIITELSAKVQNGELDVNQLASSVGVNLPNLESLTK